MWLQARLGKLRTQSVWVRCVWSSWPNCICPPHSHIHIIPLLNLPINVKFWEKPILSMFQMDKFILHCVKKKRGGGDRFQNVHSEKVLCFFVLFLTSTWCCMSIFLISLCTVQSVENQLSPALALHVRDFLEQVMVNSEEGFSVLTLIWTIVAKCLQWANYQQYFFFFFFYLSNEISTSFHFLATTFRLCAVLK